MEDHVKAELKRISERLLSGPDPYEHAGLFAAQQALSWAHNPDQFASPIESITKKPRSAVGTKRGNGLVDPPCFQNRASASYTLCEGYGQRIPQIRFDAALSDLPASKEGFAHELWSTIRTDKPTRYMAYAVLALLVGWLAQFAIAIYGASTS